MTEKLSHKERTRARILAVAAQAMREHGTDGVGVATIMKRAGLTHGGFYAHFENKDDLVAHAITRMFVDNRLMVARHLDGADPATGLSALIDDYLSDIKLQSATRGCPVPQLVGEAARMPDAARENFTAGIAYFRSRIEQALADLGRADPAGLASSVLSELVGVAALARMLAPAPEMTELLANARTQIKHRLGLV